MSRILLSAAAALLLSVSCSWLPGGAVRVAVPDKPELRALWAELKAHWKGEVPLEVVAPGSFPAADLVWEDSAAEAGLPEEKRLGANPELEAAAAGLARGWTKASSRLLPLRWNPYAWWKPWGSPALPEFRDARIAAALKSKLKFPVLIPSQDRSALAALYTQEFLDAGPSLSGSGADTVWTAWGAKARNQGEGMGIAEAARVWKAGEVGLIWASYADMAAQGLLTAAEPAPPSALPGKHQFTLVGRVQGLSWNPESWNGARVPALLSYLWSAEGQQALTAGGDWIPVQTDVPVRDAAAKAFQVRSLGAGSLVALQTPAKE